MEVSIPDDSAQWKVQPGHQEHLKPNWTSGVGMGLPYCSWGSRWLAENRGFGTNAVTDFQAQQLTGYIPVAGDL